MTDEILFLKGVQRNKEDIDFLLWFFNCTETTILLYLLLANAFIF